LRLRFIPVFSAALGLALTVGNVWAADQRTDTFTGTATTGVGAPTPVDINPADIVVRADHAIGIGYTYKANGPADGNQKGTFEYVERGHLYFTNPADPTTFAGSSFESGVFTLHTKEHGNSTDVVIADTQPSAYQQGVKTTHIGDSAALRQFEKRFGLPTVGKDVTYGFFTFTDSYGTFTGYASTDFRQFAIRITF
jgi:hypothetical protein